MSEFQIGANSVHDLQSINALRQESKIDQRSTLRTAVKEFEAFFINMLLKNMRDANKVIGEDSLLSSDDVEFFNQMHDEQLALELSRSSKFGIGDLLFKQLSVHLPKEDVGSALPDEFSSGSTKIQQNAIQIDPSRESKPPSIVTPTTGDGLSPNHSLVGQLIEQLKLLHALVDDQPLSSSATEELQRVDDRAQIKTAISTNESVLTENTKLNANAVSKMDSFSDKQSFIDTILPFAKKAASRLGLHPGVLVAQAALETGWGKYITRTDSGEYSMNLFGIKADQRWQGERVSSPTLEFNQGIPEKVQQNFRAYATFSESFEDYVDFVSDNPRYQKALENSDDPKSYLNEIQRGGYATDPDYADKVHSIFIREKLFYITD